MSKDQKDALSRVKASWAQSNDLEVNSSLYQTNDIKSVLSIIESQNQILECLGEDLEDLKDYLEITAMGSNPLVNKSPIADTTMKYIESMLTFLNYRD